MIQMRLAGIALVLATFGPVMIPAGRDLVPMEDGISATASPACLPLAPSEARRLADSGSAVLLAASGSLVDEDHSGMDWDVIIMLMVVVAAGAAIVIIQP